MKGFLHRGSDPSGEEGKAAVAAREPMKRPPNKRALKASFATWGGLGTKARAIAGLERAVPPTRPGQRHE